LIASTVGSSLIDRTVAGAVALSDTLHQ